MNHDNVIIISVNKQIKTVKIQLNANLLAFSVITVSELCAILCCSHSCCA